MFAVGDRVTVDCTDRTLAWGWAHNKKATVVGEHSPTIWWIELDGILGSRMPITATMVSKCS